MATELAKIVADFRTTLATEIAVGGTTGTLQSVTDSDGNTIPNGTYFLTLDGDGTQKEYVKCTVTGTALTSIRTINRQGVQASGTVRKHRIGAKVQITNFAHIKYMLDLLDGTTDFDASTPLKYDGVPTITSGMVETLATVDYVNGVALAGAPDAQTNVKGVVELATVAEQGTAEAVGSTGANLVPANANLVKTSSGAGDENKIAILNAAGVFADGFLDAARTWGTVQSFTADNCQITTDPDSANDAVRKSYADAGDIAGKYGDGSDGALAITSGTTTLNESTRDTYQYTSISITDTGALAIGSNHQNKPVYIFVQGDLTVTSSATPAVDARGRGGAGGAGGPAGGVDQGGDSGSSGSSGSIFFLSTTGNAGTGGTTSAMVSPSTASGGGGGGSLTSDATGGTGGTNSGVGGTLGVRSFYSANASTRRHVIGFLGGGGGGGSEPRQTGIYGRGAGGAGGAGGGCIIFVVGGNINITSVFNASGSNGENGTVGTGSPTQGGGGGGGGGGGFIGIFYAGSVTANTATFTVAGGTGGAGGVGDSGTGGAGGTGGDGASLVRKVIASEL